MAGVGLFNMAPYQWTPAGALAVQANANAINAASHFDKKKQATSTTTGTSHTDYDLPSTGIGGALGSVAGGLIGGMTGIPGMSALGGTIGGAIGGAVTGDVWGGLANGLGQGLGMEGSKLNTKLNEWGGKLKDNLFGTGAASYDANTYHYRGPNSNYGENDMITEEEYDRLFR